MKQSLTHLPEPKQQELTKIAAIIGKDCSDVEKIILFGSYARGDYREEKDLKPDRKSGFISDYDILVVTSKKETALDKDLWEKITKVCNKISKPIPVRIVTHDIEALNIKLAEGQYFYSDVKKEGILLYDSKRFELAKKRDLSAKEIQRIAQDYFEHWFGIAKGFYKHFEIDFAEIDVNRSTKANSLAAFHLHQAAEHSYKTVLLVFSNYLPNDHYLANLGRSAARKHSVFKNIFSRKTTIQKDRFQLLEYAYLGGRYDPDYYISKKDLEILAKSVKKLLELTKKACEEKIKSLVEGF